MRGFVLALIAASAAGAVHAAEPEGCGKFTGSLDRDRGLLQQASVAGMDSGGDAKAPLAAAVDLRLVPFDDVKFEPPPERVPKLPGSFGGIVRLDAPPAKGVYQVSLSAEAWLDVVQNGAILKSLGFTGARGCPGIRKSVKFSLDATPITIQFSGAEADRMRFVVSPAE